MDTAAICVVLKRLSLEISKQAQQIEWALRDTPPSVAGGKRDLLETDLRLRLESWNTEIDGLKRQIAQNENRLKMEKQRWRSPQSSAGKEQELERCRRALGAALARLYKAQNSSTAPTGMAADLGIIELADALTKPAVEFVKLAEQPTRPVFMDGTVKPPGGGTALTLLIVGRVLAAMIKKARSKG